MDRRSVSRRLYGLDHGFHSVFLDINDKGHLVLKLGNRLVDLYELVKSRGVSSAYIRVPRLIEYFMDLTVDVFNRAVEAHGYTGKIYYAYPLKAGAEDIILDTIHRHGDRVGWGFNTGSLAELRRITRYMDNPRILVIDGFKDEKVLEIASRFREKGWMVYVDIEDRRDLDLLKKWNLDLGVRVKLMGSSHGKWGSAAGIGSKFGLNITGLTDLVDEEPWLLERVKLLHVHGGSQLVEREGVSRLIDEASNLYSMLRRMGFRIRLVDHGGGIPYPYADYEHGSPSYSIHDYADMIISSLKKHCGNDCPSIVFEGGRFIVAAHRIVVSKVLSVRPYTAECRGRQGFPIIQRIRKAGSLGELRGLVRELVELRTRLYLNAYSYDLEQRRMLEELEACSRGAIAERARELIGENIGGLEELAKYMNYLLEYMVSPSHRFLLDYSVFRDIPDRLVVEDYFQPVPLQDLDKPPEVLAVLSDLTCDTMGEINEYHSPPSLKEPLFTTRDNRLVAVPGKRLRLGGVPLHIPNGDYYVAFLDTGAYQDNLSMRHNLLEKPVEIIVE